MKAALIHFALTALVPAALNVSTPVAGASLLVPVCTGDGLVHMVQVPVGGQQPLPGGVAAVGVADLRVLGVDVERGPRPLAARPPNTSLAASIAAKSPVAMAGSKLAINYAVDHPTADALQQMTLLQSAIFDTTEMAEAIAAWKDKREGEFAPLAPIPRI
mgnify:CR=1 FL=1